MQPVTHLNSQPQLVTGRVLKLALDVDLEEHVVAMQYDGSSPKPPPRFKPKDFPARVEKQTAQGRKIVSCYEAGPFGYGLHRQLTALGVTNHVIRPRNWDDEHKSVKTDRTDALAMLTALDRFVAGNKHALALVRVPTEEQEHSRTPLTPSWSTLPALIPGSVGSRCRAAQIPLAILCCVPFVCLVCFVVEHQ